MPVYDLTVDDSSPIWTYTGPWIDTDTGDPATPSYQDATFHATNQTGASASISFNGTAVRLVGAKRGNHDTYTVSLDGNTSSYNGSSAQDIFQAPLFTHDNLSAGLHEVVITDTSQKGPVMGWLDVDAVTLTFGDGNSKTIVNPTKLDDGVANFTYTSDWTNSPNDLLSSYFNQTMHRTNAKNGSMTLLFTGNHVELYGATSANHGRFSVSLDGGPTKTMTGIAPTFRPQQLLCMFSGLDSGSHMLQIQNVDPLFLDVDYAVVQSWVLASSSSSTTSPSSSSTTASASTSSSSSSHISSHHTLGVGAIIGIVIGILVWLSLVAFGILLLRRRRTASNADAYPPTKYDSEPPMAEPTRRGSLVPNRPGQLALPAPHVLPSIARISHPPAYENHSADSRIHVEDDL